MTMTTRTRNLAAAARLRIELNEALRERNQARSERDAGRQVIADQAAALHSLGDQNAYLLQERDELDAAHRAALADLGEAHRQLAERDNLDNLMQLATATVAAPAPLHDEPDMERFG
ncbi:hypothetical protein SEA_ROSMARINUS_46 [Mycobacterium Phage Rosmarinus]|uniref:Uncharacterized protein n=1 Tax=Mycobacterium phage JAWS TaxID=2922987 RepID=G1FF97_9CAUD|nr:hypothetical protein FGG34_gp54 [Mycobacterium phage JAWS]APU93150.1 hypothetical protein SEA_CREW_46 [Mycobacterium phage CREW]ASR86879.1 hypothetical protein SEA_JECKYLL_46 [Mycobacterium phage Jeckyll]AXH47076.1 hypothetical protein SEA_BEEST_46 [Mycobacterium phage BEEST]AXH50015.1 hypothetical protein SEA_HOMURA_46 [Mycobacterium phage Homura]AXQ51563.1 hypothetical protein SEA_BELLADONNA_46 [Mycobacterium phage Belladonna]AYB68904.1 hypothetical protein SEA_DALMURI_46 [Mycobacterium 